MMADDFFDEIFDTPERQERALTEMVFVSANNVIQYLEDTQTDVTIMDLPCIIPPWRVCWVEYAVPKSLSGWRISKELPINKVGVEITRGECKAGENFEELANRLCEYENGFVTVCQDHPVTIPPEARWWVRCGIYLYVSWLNRIVHSGSITFILDGLGRIYTTMAVPRGCDKEEPFPMYSVSLPRDIMMAAYEETVSSGKPISEMPYEAIGAVMNYLPCLACVLYSISLAHCKNIGKGKTVAKKFQEPEESRRRRKKLAKRKDADKRPKFIFKMLDIGPLKEEAKRAKRDRKLGRKPSVRHLVRGTQVDYREEMGKGKLFGKYHGLFWRDQHLRGSKEEGEVDKRYNIKPKKEE